MPKIIFAFFLILHGLVHLLYLGHSQGVFELQPGLTWPAGSWFFSRFLGNSLTRLLTAEVLVAATLAFAAAGVGLLLGHGWWRPLVIGAAALSSLLYLLLWNGTAANLDAQGAVAILLNVAIIVVVAGFSWPATAASS